MLSLINKLFIKPAQNKRFIEAANNNQLDELKKLLKQGAEIHANDDEALRYSAYYGHLETVKFLLTQEANIHANDDATLRLAARGGHLEIVKYLLARGANVHANNDEALRDSARREHIEVFQVLSAFIQEEKLLVAALGSMPIVAVSESTVASTWVCGTSDSSCLRGTAVGSVPQTQPLSITKTQRPKI